jgi:membrane-associated protein
MALQIDKIILSGGLIAIGATVFAESGLLIGIFLPGDTLLLGAGILASQGTLPLVPLIAIIIVSAILGDNVGYSIGRRTGPRLFRKKDGIVFRQEYIQKAEQFYEKHGGKTIILARFVPIVRTFAPLVAGVGKMPRRRFFAFNVVGGILWGGGVTLLGYWLGSSIPGLDRYITLTLILVTVATFGSAALHIFRDERARQAVFASFKRFIKKMLLFRKTDSR